MKDKKEFKVDEWLGNTTQGESVPKSLNGNGSVAEDVEYVIGHLEATQTDITGTYAEWRDIGFAFASEFGMAGRDYFHRVSRFYPKYSARSCDVQYDACLMSRGHGITIRTFFHLAREAGINIRHRSLGQFPATANEPVHEGKKADGASPENLLPDKRKVIFDTPRIAREIYTRLPSLLQDCCNMFTEDIEKDVFLVGALAVVSGCLPNVRGFYFMEPYTPHLYVFVTAPAGSGKGKLKWARHLGASLHSHLVKQARHERYEYEREMERYNSLSKTQRQGEPRPEEPKSRMFFIPANSSTSAFIQALADNGFNGMIYELEADTLGVTFKQDWGNFGDVLCKGFHHESTTMFRRTEREFIEVIDPHLAILLAGTPRQVHNIMPDVENGLFSRFLFYAFEDHSNFRNPFTPPQQEDYTAFFEEKGKRVMELYETLKRLEKPLEFSFTEEQGKKFTELFNIHYHQNLKNLGSEFSAVSRRLGLITFRIAMVLRTLRIMDDGELPDRLVCGDTDFELATKIAFTLEKHVIAVYRNLPKDKP